jgi:hypothetical protein
MNARTAVVKNSTNDRVIMASVLSVLGSSIFHAPSHASYHARSVAWVSGKGTSPAGEQRSGFGHGRGEEEP